MVWARVTTPVYKLPNIPLSVFIQNIAFCHSQQVPRVLQQPTSIGGATGSGEQVQDTWTETEDTWIRLHLLPRHTYFCPYDTAIGPNEGAVTDVRTTYLVFLDGSRKTEQHNWRDPRFAKAKTRNKWTGRSVFTKSRTEPTDSAVTSTTGAPIEPGSTVALKAGLAGLRSQLSKAQRTDPRLAEIIANLKGLKLGSYLSEPRGPGALKVRRRALKYRLTADEVLVAREEDESAAEDRPVVPDAPHVGDLPGVPRTMTWKHLILSSVHNTPTGNHRSASEMEVELKKMVADTKASITKNTKSIQTNSKNIQSLNFELRFVG